MSSQPLFAMIKSLFVHSKRAGGKTHCQATATVVLILKYKSDSSYMFDLSAKSSELTVFPNLLSSRVSRVATAQLIMCLDLNHVSRDPRDWA